MLDPYAPHYTPESTLDVINDTGLLVTFRLRLHEFRAVRFHLVQFQTGSSLVNISARLISTHFLPVPNGYDLV